MTMKSNKENSDHQGEKHLAAEASIGSDVTPNNSGVADTERVIDTSRENVVQPQIHAKRQQDNPFEANKKVRTFLNLGNGRSVNHFSQSTRMLQRRSSPPSLLDLFPVKSDHKPFTDKQPQHPARRLNFNVGSESMNMQGRTHSDPSSASSFLSRLNAVSSDTMNGPDEKRTTSSLMPPPPLARSRTFSGLTSIGNSSSSSQSFFEAKSPFLSLDSNRRSISKSNISKTSHLLPKRLGQNRSHLKQTVLDTPFLVKPPPLSFLSHASSSSSSTELTASRIGEQGKDLDSIEGVSDHEELESSVAPSLASCTAAMSTLSPPSAKVPYSLSDVTRQRRPSLADMKDSLSCPTLDTGSLSDSDDEQVSQLKVSSPCALLSKKSDSASISTTSSTLVSKRPMTLRRHQTMISSRSEFMKTLEPSGQRRSLSLIGALTKKSLVFAPENYVPDPLREDCQILPCANFVCKPDDTTKRVTPQTVVDVLDGKYKDKYDLLYIVDCRFPYEFKGGHIKSAVNVNTTDELEQLLLQPAITDKRVLLIFHCEFSCERGPRMARHLRNQDRAANSSHYPAVFYSEVYVMQGGYSGFFKENKTYCWPEAYVEMQDEKHAKEFEEHMRSFGREFSRSASKGFLGTESRKVNNDEGSAPSLSGLKSTSTSDSPPSVVSTSTASSASTPSSTNTASSDSTISSTSTTSSTNSTISRKPSRINNTLSTSTAHSAANAKNATGSANQKEFASVLTSVKEAALSGTAPSPLSLPSVSKKSKLNLPGSDRLTLHRPATRPRVVLKNLTSPTTTTACISKSGENAITSTITNNNNTTGGTNIKSLVNSSSGSNALPNPFFSGFRQTKPTFRGVSP